MTNGNDPIQNTIFFQVSEMGSRRPATHKEIELGNYLVHKEGLTKREYFAAMAMQGLLANNEWMRSYKGEKYLIEDDILAELSVSRADALIKALNETKDPHQI